MATLRCLSLYGISRNLGRTVVLEAKLAVLGFPEVPSLRKWSDVKGANGRSPRQPLALV
jgi:hypothetical protein